jgi:hypothetical protein
LILSMKDPNALATSSVDVWTIFSTPTLTSCTITILATYCQGTTREVSLLLALLKPATSHSFTLHFALIIS